MRKVDQPGPDRHAYEAVGRTADDLPYTPHFETMFRDYIGPLPDPKPTRAETWRQLLNLRKAGKLPKLGEARSRPPDVSDEDRRRLRDMLGEAIGKRDRLPYTPEFDEHRRHVQQDPAAAPVAPPGLAAGGDAGEVTIAAAEPRRRAMSQR